MMHLGATLERFPPGALQPRAPGPSDAAPHGFMRETARLRAELERLQRAAPLAREAAVDARRRAAAADRDYRQAARRAGLLAARYAARHPASSRAGRCVIAGDVVGG